MRHRSMRCTDRSDFSNNDLCAKYPELALEFAPPIHSGIREILGGLLGITSQTRTAPG
jgi:hypothetical protein